MTGQGAIDVHAHFFPAAFLDVIAGAGAPFGARVDRADARGPAILVGANRTPPLESRYYDLDRRRRSMDRQGVERQDRARILRGNAARLLGLT